MKPFFNLCLILFFAIVSLTAHAQQTETRSLSDFTRLSIAIPAEVILTKGPYKVVLEGKNLEEITSTLKGDELVIRQKDNNTSFFGKSSGNLRIFISMPNLEGISMSGSGKLESLDQFSSKHMELKLSGSGNMKVNVVADKLKAHVAGSGDIQTSGSANDFQASISGSGSVDAQELRANAVEVRISGSGDCAVHADEQLNAHITGSGNVRYSGSPSKVNAQTSGSGKISKRG